MNKLPSVPTWPHRFFKWYCRVDRYEEIHGDLEELYYTRIVSRGKFMARLLYVWDVIRCCQPYSWRKKHNNQTEFYMFKSYITVSLRVLSKTPISSLINIVGLSAAIGICVLVYAFANWTLSKDNFHVNRNDVYLTTYFTNIAGKTEQVGNSPRPLGDLLKNDFPEVKDVCRTELTPAVVKYGDQIFHERVNMVDASYLSMFTFPLKWGESSSLHDINSIILSEEAANKYFGNENPVGLELQLLFNNGEKDKLFKVTGVAQKFPESRSFSFDFLVNYNNLNWIDVQRVADDWSKSTDALLIQVPDRNDLKRIESNMSKFRDLRNQAHPEWQIISFAFEPLASLFKKSGSIRESIFSKGYDSNIRAIFFLAFIATFMLGLACFNYINIAIVSSAKRLKEIGIRKTIGATNRKVVMQFITENVLLTCFALLIGVAFGTYVVVPWFQGINSFQMDFSLMDKNLWLFLLGVLSITSLAAGLYPSIFVSRFHTAQIFKGAVRYGKQNILTKVLLGFQLVIACILIVSAFMFTSNSSFLARQHWGYEPKGMVYSQVIDSTGFQKLSDQLQQSPHVLAITGATHHIGLQHTTSILELPQSDDIEVHQLNVAHDYLQTLQLEMSQGRPFNLQKSSDKESVVINQTLAEALKFQSPVGESIRVNNEVLMIVGVVKDFYFFDFDRAIEPTLFRVAEEDAFKTIAIRVQPGKELEAYRDLQNKWASLFPDIPFQGGFQEDVWGPFFQTMKVHGRFWQGIASIAMLLAGLGLYGLVSLNVAGRTKEFSIRKILGAEARGIFMNLLKNYVWLYLLSIPAGGAISFFVVNFMLEVAYELHVPIGMAPILLAASILVIALLLVAGTQVMKLTKGNPVAGLKSE